MGQRSVNVMHVAIILRGRGVGGSRNQRSWLLHIWLLVMEFGWGGGGGGDQCRACVCLCVCVCVVEKGGGGAVSCMYACCSEEGWGWGGSFFHAHVFACHGRCLGLFVLIKLNRHYIIVPVLMWLWEVTRVGCQEMGEGERFDWEKGGGGVGAHRVHDQTSLKQVRYLILWV